MAAETPSLTIPADAASHAPSAAGDDPLWYKDAVIYQAHVKSFFDSNNDGIGDFRGVTQKLDYLQGLGITCLSRCVVEDLLKSAVLVAPPTALPNLTRRFYLVMHERKKRTRGLDLLLGHLLRHK